MSLSGYKALITGGSSGLGYEMAKQLLSGGATVIIAAREGKRLEDAKAQLSAFGDVYALAMDVMSEESVSAAAAWVAEKFGYLDMVVNNAGIGRNAPGMDELSADHEFYDIPVSAVKAVIDTNFTGYFIVASRFVPLMLKQGRGSLIYVSTSDATMTRPGQIPYGPSKAGAEAMTAILDQELYDQGIMVNIICPGGFTDTNMAGKGDKEARLKNNLPILPPDILNKTISFLASPAAAGIHGEKIVGKDFDEWIMAKQRKTIHVAAAIICENDRIFATERGYGAWKDYWEFPGGKIEPGETPEEALRREILEELDTEIEVGEKLVTVEYDYPEFHLSMDCFLAEIKSGGLVLKEHEAARWLKKSELDSVRWLPADESILELLRDREVQ